MGFTHDRTGRVSQQLKKQSMRVQKINLEKFGGGKVEITVSEIEALSRVKNDIDLKISDPVKFDELLKNSMQYAMNNVDLFPSIEYCEGPVWIEFREAHVDMTCKLTAKKIIEQMSTTS